MLNSLYIVALLALFSQTITSQTKSTEIDTISYSTYYFDTSTEYILLQTKGSIGLRVRPRTGLGGSGPVWYKTTMNSDTILIYKSTSENSIILEGGVVRDTIGQNEILKREKEKRFLIVSDNELLELDTNYPYVKTSYLDSLIRGNEVIYAAKGKTIRVPEDFEQFSDIEQLFEKPKRVKLRKLNGKEGYEKYGATGINGILEFYEKQRKCKKKK